MDNPVPAAPSRSTLTPLHLPQDTPTTAPCLADVLTGPDSLRAVVRAVADAARPIAARLAQGTLPGNPATLVGQNETGDPQKALDLGAHDAMLAALRSVPVARVVSEEAVAPIDLDRGAAWDVVIDPIDGSGSIGTGAPLGLLFGVFPAGETFLRPGRDMIAAGYVSFGHSVDLGVTTGAGTHLFTLDPHDGVYRLRQAEAKVADTASMLAFNASNLRHFDPALRAYLDAALLGRDGPRKADINMRWIAAAVGDLHRILLKGGAFLYPADARPGYADGHLRLLYEAFPIAMLMEQAGAAASDGRGDILDRTPVAIHEKTPLIFGARAEVAAIQSRLRAPA